MALEFKKSSLSKKDWITLKKLSTPQKIQDFINSLPFNFEEKGRTCMSVSRALKTKKAHCFEGALLAAAALWIQGQKPLLLDLVAKEPDDDHVVALFKKGNRWGAISKTNHSVLRYRDPIYASVRELAMSYFNEYFLKDGKKTMRSFSKPFNLTRYGTTWLTSEEDLFEIAYDLDNSPHTKILTGANEKILRKADPIEIETGEVVEWKRKG